MTNLCSIVCYATPKTPKCDTRKWQSRKWKRVNDTRKKKREENQICAHAESILKGYCGRVRSKIERQKEKMKWQQRRSEKSVENKCVRMQYNILDSPHLFSIDSFSSRSCASSSAFFFFCLISFCLCRLFSDRLRFDSILFSHRFFSSFLYFLIRFFLINFDRCLILARAYSF